MLPAAELGSAAEV